MEGLGNFKHLPLSLSLSETSTRFDLRSLAVTNQVVKHERSSIIPELTSATWFGHSKVHNVERLRNLCFPSYRSSGGKAVEIRVHILRNSPWEKQARCGESLMNNSDDDLHELVQTSGLRFGFVLAVY